MSTSVSTKRNRVYVHKFDHDLARVMREEGGLSWSEIAREFGVTPAAVRYAVDPATNLRMRSYSAGWQRGGGACVDCGAEISRNATRAVDRCRECWAIKCSIDTTTTARAETLLCTRCGEWLPDDAFGAGKSVGRRLRRTHCIPCAATDRREHRNRTKAAS